MSQLDSDSISINGHTYTCYMLPPKRAKRILIKLMKILAPTFAKTALGNKDDESIMDSDVDFGGIFERLDPDENEMITDQLAEFSHIDGKPMKPIYDVHFRGRLGDETRWFVFALKVNFSNFIGAWAEGIGPGAEILDMGSKSPNISTG